MPTLVITLNQESYERLVDRAIRRGRPIPRYAGDLIDAALRPAGDGQPPPAGRRDLAAAGSAQPQPDQAA